MAQNTSNNPTRRSFNRVIREARAANLLEIERTQRYYRLGKYLARGFHSTSLSAYMKRAARRTYRYFHDTQITPSPTPRDVAMMSERKFRQLLDLELNVRILMGQNNSDGRIVLDPTDQTPRPTTRDTSSPSYFPNSPYYADPTIPQRQDTLPRYRSTPPTETPSSFSDVTTHVTSTPQASSAAADQAVNHVNRVNHADHVDVVNHVDSANHAVNADHVNHVDHVNSAVNADPPQYDESRAWLFEPIISIENSDDE